MFAFLKKGGDQPSNFDKNQKNLDSWLSGSDPVDI